MTQRFCVYICVGIMLTYLTYIKQTNDYFDYNKKIKLLWYFIILFHLNTIHCNIMICNNFKGEIRNKSEKNEIFNIYLIYGCM